MSLRVLFAFHLRYIGTSAVGQDSWKLGLCKKVLLNTSNEDEGPNVSEISSSGLKKSKTFVVSYKKLSTQKRWERTMLIYDEKDNELTRQKGEKLSLKTPELKTLPDTTGRIQIYTINSPTDPKMKSQVRLRRVHLCTLVLQ